MTCDSLSFYTYFKPAKGESLPKQINEEEWVVLGALKTVLAVSNMMLWQVMASYQTVVAIQPFSDATNKFSGQTAKYKKGKLVASYATCGQVIPDMDALHKHLCKLTANTAEVPFVVRHACRKALYIVDKYYGKTDNSVLYHIGLCESIGLDYPISDNPRSACLTP